MGKPNGPISSVDQSKKGDLAALLDQIISDFIKGRVDSCLPAIVESFDAESNRVTVQPLIRMLQTDGTELSRGTLTVPVFSYGTSKMSLRFNLSKGDIGWMQANDRDISLFLQTFKEERPNTIRKHNFSDSIFYPDAMKGMAFTADAVMSNADGTVKTEWFSDKIVHTAPMIEIYGDLSVSGSAVVSGEVTGNGVLLSIHDHDYIDTVNGTPSTNTTDEPN